ncbi:hypothetical protein AMAG_05457 [Allomyces macrogynus ATCC 38327]|uniref:Calnexin n=1 Tax=Allomyces macrogynus (strain ATCC 38327) TaxID=578462 RepID=A0A0L0SBV0_ALLM3|nr:hypothetical protein AMAG_05457 [Allomyces macrogynus ATCC 38327]|eukprot:KNE60018.1 hypothetical protein AMAG_05457 [Allomyces macrogynus ATCC 38327]
MPSPSKTAAAALALLALSSAVAADAPAAAAAKPDAAAAPAAKPVWKPSTVSLPSGSLGEQFASVADFEKHWIPSRASKEDVPAGEKDSTEDADLWRYRGQWAVEEATETVGAHAGDLGLVLKSAAAHHAISRALPQPITFEGHDAVTVQYEVKLQNGLECGGAYLKLLSHDATKVYDPATFSDKTPYTIMFGPDKCGATNKVHFIFRHKNKKTGKIVEHHLKNPPSVPSTYSKETHLYTLIVHPEKNTFEIKIDGVSKQTGSLLDDFEPPVVAPKEIDDPNDKKPADWVDEAKIPDPKATKPAEWDEDAPLEIEDADATMPADWLENEPEYIPDPDAKQPEDWDAEEDGEWVAPTVANPKCAEASGCGPWTRPMKRNPDYKGKWAAPLIDNPAYKGPWAPRKIANPDYVDEKHPGYMTPIGAVGFELWTMQNNIQFDNILVSDSVNAATLDQWTKDTWEVKHAAEEVLTKADEPEKAKDAENDDDEIVKPINQLTFGDIVEQLTPASFVKFAQKTLVDPAKAAASLPITAGAAGLSVAAVIAFILALLTGPSAADKKKKQKVQSAAAKKKKDDDADADEAEVEQEEEEEEIEEPAAKASPEKASPAKTTKRPAKKEATAEDDE